MASNKMCGICGKRRVATGKHSGHEDREYCAEQGFCYPCGDEGQMEINHDNGHESYTPDECWLCRPELNEAQKPVKAKASSTKAKPTSRNPQLRHKLCQHEQTPEGRRACRKAFWAQEGITPATVTVEHFAAWFAKQLKEARAAYDAIHGKNTK